MKSVTFDSRERNWFQLRVINNAPFEWWLMMYLTFGSAWIQRHNSFRVGIRPLMTSSLLLLRLLTYKVPLAILVFNRKPRGFLPVLKHVKTSAVLISLIWRRFLPLFTGEPLFLELKRRSATICHYLWAFLAFWPLEQHFYVLNGKISGKWQSSAALCILRFGNKLLLETILSCIYDLFFLIFGLCWLCLF